MKKKFLLLALVGIMTAGVSVVCGMEMRTVEEVEEFYHQFDFNEIDNTIVSLRDEMAKLRESLVSRAITGQGVDDLRGQFAGEGTDAEKIRRMIEAIFCTLEGLEQTLPHIEGESQSSLLKRIQERAAALVRANRRANGTIVQLRGELGTRDQRIEALEAEARENGNVEERLLEATAQVRGLEKSVERLSGENGGLRDEVERLTALCNAFRTRSAALLQRWRQTEGLVRNSQRRQRS